MQLMNIKCLFGFHEWEECDLARWILGRRNLKQRRCEKCGKTQKQKVFRRFDRFMDPNPKSIFHYETEWETIDFNYPEKYSENARDISWVIQNPPPHPFHSKLPKVTVDTPMPECKEPRKDNEIDLKDLYDKTIIDGYGEKLVVKRMHNDKMNNIITLKVSTKFKIEATDDQSKA